MEAGLVAFADRAGIRVRYGCRWEATRRDDAGLVVVTSDGEYRCRAAVFAVGATEPWVPAIPGLELGDHYASLDGGRERYQGRRVVIIGKRNSAFEVGEGLLTQGVRELTLVSPRPADTARLARSPLRPWYLTPYDEHARGAPGRFVLDASIDRVERRDGGVAVHALDRSHPEPLVLEADVVIAATGFQVPLQDLRDARARHGRERPHARVDAVLGERDAAGDLLRRERDAGVARAAASTASRACRAWSAASATTRGCSRATSPRRCSVERASARASSRRTSCRSSSTS